MGTSTPDGYLSAVLNIRPGHMSYWTTASSIPANACISGYAHWEAAYGTTQ